MSRPNFVHSYLDLGESFYTRQSAEPVADPQMIRINRGLATDLGLDAEWLASKEGTAVLAGNRDPDGAKPLAAVYAGHQFGSWNPRLGDGRALLLGEVIAPNGVRYDIQLKGSGRTPYSRGGDGRAPLGPVLREYVVSEAMAAFGVPTTRSLAAAATGERVFRDRALPGGVLTRVAQSHIRVGTFEYFASIGDRASLEQLTAHVLERHYPELPADERTPIALLSGVTERQAKLIAQWLLLGFIHGVMNTDNMLVSGETIDYGPCAFMDAFVPGQVFSSIDRGGRYAYDNQPLIAAWNLTCLAQALLPLAKDPQQSIPEMQAVIEGYQETFRTAHQAGLARKLALDPASPEDAELAVDLLRTMAESRADFTLTFRYLTELANPESSKVTLPYQLPDALGPWVERWQTRLRDDAVAQERKLSMVRCNPALIPRNHQIEAVIESAVENGDLDPFHRLVDALVDPFELTEEHVDLARAPAPEEVVQQTFCGT